MTFKEKLKGKIHRRIWKIKNKLCPKRTAPFYCENRAILKYFKSNLSDTFKNELLYIRKNGFNIFPYSFNTKYKPVDVEVFTDESGLKYVIQNGHRLYFTRQHSAVDIQWSYAFLNCEQDPDSPHCYANESCKVEQGDVLFDVGAAEGNFSLAMIEKVSKLYIFEADVAWIEALERTFEPWKEKVTIINKFASDHDSESTVTIDSITKYLQKNSSLFLKLDVEGAEQSVLNGAMLSIGSGAFKVKAIVCTYHHPEDYENLSNFMLTKGFTVETTKGYMLFPYNNNLKPPYFRRGLIYCSK